MAKDAFQIELFVLSLLILQLERKLTNSEGVCLRRLAILYL